MAILDRLAFWKKKEDDFGLGQLDKSLNMSTGLPSSDVNQGQISSAPPLNSTPFSQQPAPQYGNAGSPFEFGQQQQQPFQEQNFAIQKEVEVVSAKLDAIKAALENIGQRLANLERLAYSSSEQAPVPRQYYREYPPRSY